MDRAACRTVLELTDVRVERLQDISEEDAKAEGVIQTPFGSWVVGGNGWTNTTFSGGPIDVFSEYWDSLAKPGEKWGDNPFVWRIEFRRVEDAELV